MRSLLLSSLLVAALLPALIIGVSGPGSFRLLTQAEEPSPLRLWFEPDSVVVSPSQTFDITLMAQSDDPNRPIPRLSLDLNTTGGVSVSPASISHARPFLGRVEVARLSVTAPAGGSGSVDIIAGSIATTLPDLPAIVSPIQITVE